MNSARFAWGLCWAASATLPACGDPLVAPELIADTRVLAARTEAADDINRASVMPLQAASVRWLVAGPNGPVALGWSGSACIAEPVSRGLPSCVTSPFAHFVSTDVSTSEPRFELTVPDAASLVSAPQIAVSAAFCVSGTPTQSALGVDFSATRCPDASEAPLFATSTLMAQLDGTANANPSLDRVALQFDGADWAAWSDESDAATACTDPGLAIPRVAAGGTNHTITLMVPADMSEPLPRVSVHSAARETLGLAHFVTAGDLERAYSDVSVQADPAVVHVNWNAPGHVATDSALVRFYFVLRDGRGGADYTVRAVCVTP